MKILKLRFNDGCVAEYENSHLEWVAANVFVVIGGSYILASYTTSEATPFYEEAGNGNSLPSNKQD